ncbi:MAG TPA: tetratricopeptide repeat protein [Ktedonobacteraceae bacterium]
MALMYLHQKDYEQAESFLQQALTLQSKMLSDDHPDIADTLQNLGDLYYEQQRNSEALPLFEQALAIRRQRKEEDHPHTQAILEIYKDLLQLTQNGND